MCGRYTLHLKRLEALRRLVQLTDIAIEPWQPRFNAAPGQDLPVIREGVLTTLRWGLLPNWARDPKAKRPINARIETLAQLPTFREPFNARRCVVPATGYFEWRPTPPKARRDPVWVHPRGSAQADEPGLMMLAAVWDRWLSREGEVLDSYAIVTMEASEAMRTVHDRMPLELRGGDVERWLMREPISASELDAIASRSRDTDHLALHAVTPAVGATALDDPRCIQPEARAQLGMFG